MTARTTRLAQRLEVYLLGEDAVVLSYPPPLCTHTQQTLLQLAAALTAGTDDIVECLPGVHNLTVRYDPLRIDADQVLSRVATAQESLTGPAAVTAEPRLHTLPVTYGGTDGPDLEFVAAHCRLPPEEVIKRHSEAVYTVFCLGFQPGFAYMGGLDPSLTTPRRDEPRTAVPAGAVGIAGTQTGVYANPTPGGWQLIGRTTAVMFDLARTDPCLLRPGDRIRFVALTSRP